MTEPLTLTRRIYSRLPEPVQQGFRSTRRAVRSWMHPQYPRVFLNSIPKAGTHLLTTLLERMDYFLYWNQPFNPNMSLDCDPATFHPHLDCMRAGEYIVEHLPWVSGAQDTFQQRGIRVVFVYRDPRAAAISFARYVAEQHPSHRLHKYFASLPDLDARVRATLEGIPGEKSLNGHGRPPHGALYDAFLPWKSEADVWSASFEALVGERGGGSNDLQRKAVEEFFHHLGIPGSEERIRKVAQSVFNENAATFRSAQIDGWRREVSEETGHLLDATLARQVREWGYA